MAFISLDANSLVPVLENLEGRASKMLFYHRDCTPPTQFTLYFVIMEEIGRGRSIL